MPSLGPTSCGVGRSENEWGKWKPRLRLPRANFSPKEAISVPGTGPLLGLLLVVRGHYLPARRKTFP